MHSLTFTGFYGQRNVGDESFISVLKDYFPDAIFTPGVFTGKETDVVVGGGEFDTWMIKNAPAPRLYGVGVGLVRDAIGEERASLLRRFKYLALRDAVSYSLCHYWRISATLSADLAYLLKPKNTITLQNKIIVVPRKDVDPWPYLQTVDTSKVVFVPFHPYDLETDLKNAPVCPITDPQEMLGAIASAEKVFCFGKLHPKIFAHNTGVPWFDFMPDVKGLAFQQMVEDFSVQDLRTIAYNMLRTLKNEISA